MLLELLSHQNFADMRYGSDPRFKFLVSRAIYKAILRHVSFQYGRPLRRPAAARREGFSAVFAERDDEVRLQWHGVEDPLEASASPTGYVLYTRIGDGDFRQRRAGRRDIDRRATGAGRNLQLPRHGDQCRRREFSSETLSAAWVPEPKGACWWSTASTA